MRLAFVVLLIVAGAAILSDRRVDIMGFDVPRSIERNVTMTAACPTGASCTGSVVHALFLSSQGWVPVPP